MHFLSTNISPGSLVDLYQFPPMPTDGNLHRYTDPLGCLWVAKAGTYSQWMRATDVLHGRWGLSGAYNIINSANQKVPLDYVFLDVFDLYNGVTDILTLPFAGSYHFYGQVGMTPTATGQYCNVMIRQNGTRVIQNQAWSGGTGAGINPQVNATLVVGDGDTFYLETYTLSGASFVAQNSPYITFMGFDYLGSLGY